MMDGLVYRFVGLDGNNMTLSNRGSHVGDRPGIWLLCTGEVEFYSTPARYENANERIMRIES